MENHQHTSFLHVIDARTFETEQIVRIPSVPTTRRPSPAQPLRMRRRPNAYQSNVPSYTYGRSRPMMRHNTVRPPPPPPFVVLALEDTFRISSSWDQNSPPSPIDEEDIVIIPPLGDPQVEDDVQTLLGHHNIHSRHSDDFDRDYEPSEDMDVDELESDCISSHTPSRSSSPSPSVHIGTSLATPRGRSQSEDAMAVFEGDPDIAGTCFDPSGGYIYVATTDGITEWEVSGAEKRWWHDSDWQ